MKDLKLKFANKNFSQKKTTKQLFDQPENVWYLLVYMPGQEIKL